MKLYWLLPPMLLVAVNSAAETSTQSSPIEKAVTHCVGAVHDTRPADGYMASFYKHFDAFYNPASKEVENNAKRVGDQDALFVFNKCMMKQGFPLKY